eukprot:4608037-Amphidinium_carterae.1
MCQREVREKPQPSLLDSLPITGTEGIDVEGMISPSLGSLSPMSKISDELPSLEATSSESDESGGEEDRKTAESKGPSMRKNECENGVYPS